jgi:hypothetical protein
LDLKNKSIEEGTSVIQNTLQKISRQIWSVTNVGSNYYSIINDSSKLCIDVNDQSVEDSALIIQNAYSGNESQQWSFDFLGQGFYKIINRKSGKSLEVKGASLDEGTSLIQRTFTDSTFQHFMMVSTDVSYSYPVASIISPFTGSVYAFGSDIQIEVYAEDWDGVISKVDFYIADSIISTDTISPFACLLKSPAAGTYQISVVATDDENYSSIPANITITVLRGGIQENETGFCSVEGTIDNNHPGFTGNGFANPNNAVGAGINWKLNVPVSGTCTLAWRYANGSGSRAGRLLANNQEIVAMINMTGTGSWTTWAVVSVSAVLPAGEVELRLEALGSDGLANIDYLEITGIETVPVHCAPTGIQLNKMVDDNYEVHPNPFTDEITIRSFHETGSEIRLELFNSIGKLIKSKILLNQITTLTVEDIPSGFYYIRFTGENQISTIKIIKK